MKPNSILLFGLALAPLFGCGGGSTQAAQTPPQTPPQTPVVEEIPARVLIFEGSPFVVNLPCVPKSASAPTVDRTPYGSLHAQDSGCWDTAKRNYVVTVGVFEDAPPELLDASTKKATNAKIAATFADMVCRAMLEKDSSFFCKPELPVTKAGKTDVLLTFGKGSHVFPALVRVAYPYLATVGAIGSFKVDDLKTILDVKLPAYGDTN